MLQLCKPPLHERKWGLWGCVMSTRCVHDCGMRIWDPFPLSSTSHTSIFMNSRKKAVSCMDHFVVWCETCKWLRRWFGTKHGYPGNKGPTSAFEIPNSFTNHRKYIFITIAGCAVTFSLAPSRCSKICVLHQLRPCEVEAPWLRRTTRCSRSLGVRILNAHDSRWRGSHWYQVEVLGSYTEQLKKERASMSPSSM